MLAWPDSCKTGRKPATLEWVLTTATFKLRITRLPATSLTAIFPQLFSNTKSNPFLAGSARRLYLIPSPPEETKLKERIQKVYEKQLVEPSPWGNGSPTGSIPMAKIIDPLITDS
jgi:hypothetical protein